MAVKSGRDGRSCSILCKEFTDRFGWPGLTEQITPEGAAFTGAKLITLQRSVGRLEQRLIFSRPAATINITWCSARSISLTSRVIDLCCCLCILLLLFHLFISFRAGWTAVLGNTHGAIDGMTSAPRDKDTGEYQHQRR
jgi:hypothetical protein